MAKTGLRIPSKYFCSLLSQHCLLVSPQLVSQGVCTRRNRKKDGEYEKVQVVRILRYYSAVGPWWLGLVVAGLHAGSDAEAALSLSLSRPTTHWGQSLLVGGLTQASGSDRPVARPERQTLPLSSSQANLRPLCVKCSTAPFPSITECQSTSAMPLSGNHQQGHNPQAQIFVVHFIKTWSIHFLSTLYRL